MLRRGLPLNWEQRDVFERVGVAAEIRRVFVVMWWRTAEQSLMVA